LNRRISHVFLVTSIMALSIVVACSEASPEASVVSSAETEAKITGKGVSTGDKTPTPQTGSPESDLLPATLEITPAVVVTKTPIPASTNTPDPTVHVETPPAVIQSPTADIPTATPVAVPTITATVEPLPTPDEISTPMPTPVPTATHVPTPTTAPTATLVPRPTVVPTATLVPTVTSTVVPTVWWTPIPIPTAAPIPTVTPVPVPDDRFGVVAVGNIPYQTSALGVTWYLDFTPITAPVPAGLNKVSYIGVKPSTGLRTPQEIAQWAANAPGSVWVIGGEVNVGTNDYITPSAYVDVFDYYYEHIKAADPTARISGPSILNWEFTCSGCGGGFQSGQSWFTAFINQYAATHDGASPPADIWAIDVYPLTWLSLPMTDWNIVINQILDFRTYLSTQVPGHATTPIYINEVASHWGFSRLEWIDGKTSIPTGWSYTDDFLWDEMELYLITLLDWLKESGPSLYIERWFLYATHVNISESAAIGYAGIELFDGYFAGANMNRLGLLYRDYATGVK
jgi:hypothetical protein